MNKAKKAAMVRMVSTWLTQHWVGGPGGDNDGNNPGHAYMAACSEADYQGNAEVAAALAALLVALEKL